MTGASVEALKVKYEQNRAEVLKHLDVSSDLLDLMTRYGLIDIADCVKYRGIYDVKKRNGSLMKTMVERRTDKAYPLFIQSLRQAGQDSVANLLTDIGEETRILTHLQTELENEIGSIADYLKQEERRTGVTAAGLRATTPTPNHTTTTTTTNYNDPHQPPPPPTSDREVWVGVQSTLKRAGQQFGRCRAVMEKLHQDCRELATANGDMMTQIRSCYSRVKRMLKPGQDDGDAEVPKSTQAMFQNLIEDVEKLMNRKSKAQQLENEGRTTAMRMLRHLRDWIQERSSILDTLHTSTTPTTSGSPSPRAPRLPLLSSRRGTVVSSAREAGQGHSHAHTPPLHPPPSSSSPRQQTPSPTRSQTHSEDTHNGGAFHTTTSIFRNGSNSDPGHGQLHHATTTSAQPHPHTDGEEEEEEEGVGGAVRAVHVRHVEVHAISTVLEGLQLLEQQVRHYVHLEIWLTDKFRAEMRYRHLRKRSHGFSPAGLEEARRAMERLESGASHMTSSSMSSSNGTLNVSRNGLGVGGGGGGGGGGDSKLYLSRLRASLDAMCDEYSDCVHYMSRVSKSLVKIPDVDSFLAYIDNDNHDQHRHTKKNKKGDKERKNRQTPTTDDNKPASSVFAFFTRKKPDPKTTPSPSSSSSSFSHFPIITTSASSSKAHNPTGERVLAEDSLLLQLKQLVGNYEMVKQKLARLEDRFRREYDHKRRAFDAAVRDRDEEIRSLQLRLKETEAEKEKFRSLYDKMKVAFAKKR